MPRKKVLVLGTGGTIASACSDHGLIPTHSDPSILYEINRYQEILEITYEEILNLDSSNIQVEEWLTIATAIWRSLSQYDGIVVLHGTDTMAYTTSVLSYMLAGVDKPIVFTGSQTPMSHRMSDGPMNLALALEGVLQGVGGVTIAFHNKLIHGTRAVKVRTKGFDAFASINAPYRGQLFADGLQVNAYDTPTVVPSSPTTQVLCNDVFLLKLIPGTNPMIFDALANMQYKGIVIESFGAGGMHYIRRDLLSSIKNLVDRGIAVAVCSQCLYEPSDFSIYEVGQKLMATGAIPTGDMTTEAVVTKLMWCLGKTTDLTRVREMFLINFAGEVTL